MTSPAPKAPEFPPLLAWLDPKTGKIRDLTVEEMQDYARAYGAPLLAEIERLKADVQRLHSHADAVEKKWMTTADERNELRAQLEAERKDAERYRWLRDDAPDGILAPFTCWECGCQPDQLDAAIDAARSGK